MLSLAVCARVLLWPVPAAFVSGLLTLVPASARPSLTLELRVFDGAEEVTAETRVSVHRAGDRTQPIAQSRARAGRLELQVPPGIYDVQALRESGGRVVDIRWADRLVVMAYPDEAGRHLEVINLRNGYGALQVRSKDPVAPTAGAAPVTALVLNVTLHASGVRDREVAQPVAGDGYVLFVVPAGRYDVQTKTPTRPAWHTDIDVPLDRTRLWLVQ